MLSLLLTGLMQTRWGSHFWYFKLVPFKTFEILLGVLPLGVWTTDTVEPQPTPNKPLRLYSSVCDGRHAGWTSLLKGIDPRTSINAKSPSVPRPNLGSLNTRFATYVLELILRSFRACTPTRTVSRDTVAELISATLEIKLVSLSREEQNSDIPMSGGHDHVVVDNCASVQEE